MDDQNEVVIERYPTDKLPADLRERGDLGSNVRIVIEPIREDEQGGLPLTSIVEAMQRHRTLSDDPVERIRAPRAEDDWRDELHARIRAGNG